MDDHAVEDQITVQAATAADLEVAVRAEPARHSMLVDSLGELAHVLREPSALNLGLDPGGGVKRDAAAAGELAQVLAGVVLGQDKGLLTHPNHHDPTERQVQEAHEVVVVTQEGSVAELLLHLLFSRVSTRSCERPLSCCSVCFVCGGINT